MQNYTSTKAGVPLGVFSGR